MHGEFRHLRYAVRWLDPAARRHPKSAQRLTASAIHAALGPDWRLASHSHSRGTVAVCVANPPITCLGVDVEYADPARPWREIAALYLPSAQTADLDASAFCRLWTFGEAHFKAFGQVPPAGLLLDYARAPLCTDEPVAFGSRRHWYTEALPLSLIHI